MDEHDEHWKDILSIAKDNKAKQSPVTALDSEKTAELDANIFAHIDQQFGLDTSKEVEHSQSTNQPSEKNGVWASLSASLRGLMEPLSNIGRAPALAMLAVVAVSFGLIFNTSNTPSPFLDIPDSLIQANLDKQLVLTGNGQRALSSNSSPRRNAFVMGTIQAGLDTANEGDGNSTAAIINNYPSYFGENADSAVSEKLALFQSQIESLTKDAQSKIWLEEGYLVEMIHLASLHAMNNAKMPPLNDALQYFEKLTTLESNILKSDDLDANYISSRKALTTNKRNEAFVPDEVQQLIDSTQAMQVLVQ